MSSSKKDPRQIITPFAFSIHPDLLGLPLATPKRRLAAMLIDLTFASLVSAASLRSEEGAVALATILTIILFWVMVRMKTTGFLKTSFKYAGSTIAAFWIFIALVAIFELSRPGEADWTKYATFSVEDEEVPAEVMNNMDWEKFGERITAEESYNTEEFFETLADEIENATQLTYSSSSDNQSFQFPESQVENLRALRTAIVNQDTVAYDSLRAKIVDVIAKPEINDLKLELKTAEQEADSLIADNEELQEIVDNPGFMRIVKSLANDLGLTFGWIGVYFILSLVLLKGRTPGKKLLGLQVVRLNGKPMTFLYSLERFGGYAAGLVTGTIGFIQLLWDPNRQAIHDKIAGTVVIDTRESKLKKFEHLTQEIRDSENLLSQF